MSKHMNINQIKEMQRNGKDAEARKIVQENIGLTLEQYYALDTTVHETAMRKALLGRKLANIIPVAGREQLNQIDYYTMSHMGAAQIRDVFGENSDAINLTKTQVRVPILEKTFEIDRRQLGTGTQNLDQSLFSMTLESATKVAMEKEDEYVIMGFSPDNGTTYTETGLYTGAGQDYATASHWSTVANIEASIIGAIKLLYTYNYFGPYNLLVNPAEAVYLNYRDTYTEETYWERATKLLKGGQIFISADITAGKGLLLATKDTNMGSSGAFGKYPFELKQALDLTFETEELEKSHNVFGRVYLVERLLIYDTNALCKLSDIA